MTTQPCIHCGAVQARASCDVCVEWADAGPEVPPSENEPGYPQPAPPIGTDFETRIAWEA